MRASQLKTDQLLKFAYTLIRAANGLQQFLPFHEVYDRSWKKFWVQSNGTCFQIEFESLANVGSGAEQKWLDGRVEAVFRVRNHISAFPLYGMLDAVQIWPELERARADIGSKERLEGHQKLMK
ncbi:uncharacterized protein RHO25_010216 [Cercospora beticola]|uniref:Uncharacterized protein n=1 Tax=Cercospora beticola TaxID=122368 RepID=A0ABZ0P1D1_CERBT|nr:hypothetical protein RHO25_010216 [Cercospora beticola]